MTPHNKVSSDLLIRKITVREARRNLALIRLHRDLTDLLDTYGDDPSEDDLHWLEWSRRMRDDLSSYLRQKGY